MGAKVKEHGRWLARDPAAYVQHLDHKLRPERRLQKIVASETGPDLRVELDPENESRPSLNILLPELGAASLTGGPNTALNIACGVAALGVPTRVLTTNDILPASLDRIWAHLRDLTGKPDIPNLSFQSTYAAAAPARLGRRDVFLATLWTTAFRLQPVLPRMARPEFLYLIQDFEPSFYPWSTAYAQAIQTYDMPFRALINERLLADYFVSTHTGRFAGPGFLDRCAVFEPAVDTRLFHPVEAPPGRKRLLFYARPNQPRNLFTIGLEALRLATQDPAFADPAWQFTAMGDSSLPALPLGNGRVLEPAPWLSYAAYAQSMREADILLCPMLSPHTSYPVLEMAACRGIAVTNAFGSKTQERLDAMAGGVLAGPATIEGFRDRLLLAAVQAGEARPARASILPSAWQEALRETIGSVKIMFDEASRD